jgi:hypothetical protein
MHTRFTPWTAFVDMLITTLVVILTMVGQKKTEAEGPNPKAEFLISAEWNVDIDADVDLWLVTPSKKPVFYGSREVGCATLDRDSRGFLDDHVTLADGSIVKVSSDKETITLRCIEPGRFDVGVNLFEYRAKGLSAGKTSDAGLSVHVEVVGLNPTIKTLYSGDVTPARVGETVNATSFDLSNSGELTLREPPLERVTRAYIHPRPAGVP